MAPRNVVNQLIIATIAGAQAGVLTDRLTRDEFYVTQVDTSGGILREATIALLIGLDRAHLPRLLEDIRECCPTRRQFIPVKALEAHDTFTHGFLVFHPYNRSVRACHLTIPDFKLYTFSKP